jgi:dihydroorotase
MKNNKNNSYKILRFHKKSCYSFVSAHYFERAENLPLIVSFYENSYKFDTYFSFANWFLHSCYILKNEDNQLVWEKDRSVRADKIVVCDFNFIFKSIL